MQVSFVYRTPLPSTTAASISFVNTLRELAALGVTARVCVPRLDLPPEACLAHYGVEPHPRLHLERLPGFYHDDALARRLQQLVRSGPPGERHVLMTRGEPGLRVFDLLRGVPRQPGERRVLEQHRLCWAYAAERRAPGRPVEEVGREDPEVAEVRRREAAAVADADALVCITPGVLDWLRKLGGPQPPALVVDNGTALADGPPRPDAERDIDVLYVGKLKDRKGTGLLLDALIRLPGVRAVLAGGSEMQVADARAEVARRGLADRVTLPGYVPPGRLAPLLARARVGVCPLPAGVSVIGDHFTQPLKLLAMMGHHVPIVATDLPTVRAVVEDGRTALLAPPNDPDALAGALRRLLEDRPLASRLADAARTRAADFTWGRRARRLHAFLDGLP